jgi:ferredoxin
MAHTVTRLCQDNKDTACVAVCPVDCFYVPKVATEDLPDRLYISPGECIDCGACIEACPWQAIFADSDVPPAFADDTPLNARSDSERDLFDKAVNDPKTPPSPEEVEANKKKWGL